MQITNVTVAGGGVLGSQIAFQAAYSGKNVTIWLRSEESKTRTQPKLDNLRKTYVETIERMAAEGDVPGVWARGIAATPAEFDRDACLAKVETAYSGIKLMVDMTQAFGDADLVVESMAENPKDKTAFYQKLAPFLPQKTLLVTNSSTLLPSQFAGDTGRPAKYLALHFANSIWKNNTAEVMAQEQTDPAVFDDVVRFAQEIGMVALPIRKEKSGYLLNSMLVPFLLSGLDLVVNGVSDPESVDKAWTMGTGAPKGPFQIMDTVGLTTAYNIVEQYQKVPGLINPLLRKMMLPYNYKGMKAMLQKYIDEGKLGVSAGEGFYKYGK